MLISTLRSKAVSKAYEVYENPGRVYKECVVSGKNSVVKAKVIFFKVRNLTKAFFGLLKTN